MRPIIEALREIQILAEALVTGPHFQRSSGGDRYEYIGSTTAVDVLKEAINRYHTAVGYEEDIR